MALLIHPRLWGQQRPSPGARVQPGHPLAHGLVGYWLFTGGGTRTPSLTGPSQGLVYSATPTWLATGAGVSGGTYMEAVSPGAPVNASIMMGVIPRSSGLCRHAQWDSVGPVLYYTGSSLALVFSNSFDYAPGGLPYTIGQPAMIGTSITSGSLIARLFVGQSHFAYAVGSNTHTYSAFTLAVRVGAGGLGGAVDASDAIYQWAGIWNRALTPAEAEWLWREPYAILAPPAPRLRYWVTVPATTPPLPITPSGQALRAAAMNPETYTREWPFTETLNPQLAQMRLAVTRPVVGATWIAYQEPWHTNKLEWMQPNTTEGREGLPPNLEQPGANQTIVSDTQAIPTWIAPQDPMRTLKGM